LRAEIFGRVSPSHLVPWVPLCCFVCSFVVCFLLCFQVPRFLQSLHVLLTLREPLTDKATCSIGYGAKKNRSCRILEVSVALSRFVSLLFSFFWRAVDSDLRSLVSPDFQLRFLLTVLLPITLMASITFADALSSQSRATLGYGAFHRHRLRNGLSVFDTLDLGAN